MGRPPPPLSGLFERLFEPRSESGVFTVERSRWRRDGKMREDRRGE